MLWKYEQFFSYYFNYFIQKRLKLLFQNYNYTVLEMKPIYSRFQQYSKDVESEYQDVIASKIIREDVIDRYLKKKENKCEKYYEDIVSKIIPYWQFSMPQLFANIKGLVTSNWPFSEENYSIYLVFWGPVTLTFLSCIIHHTLFQKNLNSLFAGLCDFGLILLIGVVTSFYSTVLNFPYNKFLEHACVASHMNILTIIYCCISMAIPSILVIPASIIYVGLSTYLHFNIYNQAIKPTLLEFLILLFIIVIFYVMKVLIFYILLFKVPENSKLSPQSNLTYQHLRQFNQVQ